MMTIFLTLILSLNIRVEQSIEGLSLTLIGKTGNVIRQISAGAPGDYALENLEPGVYTLRASVGNTTVVTIPDIVVPATKPIVVKISPDAVAQETARRPQVGAQRNENIQINLIDNNALNEQLGRQGAEVRLIPDFTAVRSNYAAEFGGLGRNLEIITADSRKVFHGEISEALQNSVFNARTYFQVGPVRPYRRNQYGANFGGPLLTNRFSFVLSAEEVRQSGFVNGNVLIPRLEERTPLVPDPRLFSLISRWLEAFPKEIPNRSEVDPRMLNTNALQTIRSSAASVRFDWERKRDQSFSLRYSFVDTYIDSFEFVAGQNPNQRLRPQTLNIAANQRISDRTSARLGFNYLRRKAHLLVPPGAVGPHIIMSRQVEDLGPRPHFPILRVQNDFEYLGHISQIRGNQHLDLGAEVRRYQLNGIQSDEARGVYVFNHNFGRSSIENLLLGTASHYRTTIGELNRGFRNSDLNLFFNNRLKLIDKVDLTIGLRYELVTAPHEADNLTQIPYDGDKNNFAPRVGFAYGIGKHIVRGGYGIAFGRVFPATFQWSRFNPPEVLRIAVPNPDVLNPLKDYRVRPGEAPRTALNLLDPNLVVPYSQHYTLQVERELPASLRLRAAYMGSRTWKLFQTIYGNRAARPEGIPITTLTINDRRPDQRYYGVSRIANMGRAYFDGLQLSMEKSTGHGLAFRATYTWSKVIDTGTEFSGTAVNDDELRAQDDDIMIQDLKSVSRFDAPHGLVITYSYRLPRRWLKGWSISGTTLFRSGTPFTIEAGTDSPPWGNVDGEWQDRPSILDPSLLGRSIDDPDTSQTILRRSAFTSEDAFLRGRGSLGRNTFRKDGGNNFNLALTRTFSLSSDGSRSATFRAEAINLMNHAQFDAPNNSFASPSFGRITNTVNSGRVLQFVLNVKF